MVGVNSFTFFFELKCRVLRGSCCGVVVVLRASTGQLRGEWPSGLYSLRQVTEVKLGGVRSNSGWVTSEA